MIKLVIIILIEVQANEHAPASSYNSLFPPLSKLSIFDPVRDAFDICMVTRIITCVRNLKVDLPYEYELCITQAFKHCFSNPMYQNLPRYKAVFFFFFGESFNLWRPLLMIAHYHQTKTPMPTWLRKRRKWTRHKICKIFITFLLWIS